VDLLRARGLTLATAESLTGGAVGEAVTSVPGASAVYAGGVVTYATRVKVELLGVPQEVVDHEGVVSAACASAMADRVRLLVGATVGLATTGVAGPEPQEGRPVGLVYVAVADASGVESRELSLSGDRAAIRSATVAAVLALAGDRFREAGSRGSPTGS
jgi:PncC family amidohydrolase